MRATEERAGRWELSYATPTGEIMTVFPDACEFIEGGVVKARMGADVVVDGNDPLGTILYIGPSSLIVLEQIAE